MQTKSEGLSKQIDELASGQETSTSLVMRALEFAELHKNLNPFVSLNRELVLDQARESDKRRNAGAALSSIDGIPIAIKDNYLTKDYPTTACSDARPLEPADIDATVVAKLRAAGAVIFAKTNMHEWAYGATNATSNIGVTRNPHNPDHITGGSSGGSGVAVASGIVAAALGSDTGGSVRIPSSACGIYGFKPGYGRASRYGILPLSWSLDAPGPMTARLDDIPHLLPYFFGEDSKDISTTGAKEFKGIPKITRPRLLHLTGQGLERSAEIDSAIKNSIDRVDAIVVESELPGIHSYFAAWETILHCEASSYHEHLLEENPAGFSTVTRAHLEAGMQLSGVELLKAQKIRTQLINVLLNELPEWDAIILPTLPVTAPAHDLHWQEFDGRKVTTQDSMTWFCWIANLAGLPGITIPIAKSNKGLPIGLMLMGKPGRDEELLAIAGVVDPCIN